MPTGGIGNLNKMISEAEILVGLDKFVENMGVTLTGFLLNLKAKGYLFISMDKSGHIKAFRSRPMKLANTGIWMDVEGGHPVDLIRVSLVHIGTKYDRARDSHSFAINDLIIDQSIIEGVKSIGKKKGEKLASDKGLLKAMDECRKLECETCSATFLSLTDISKLEEISKIIYGGIDGPNEPVQLPRNPVNSHKKDTGKGTSIMDILENIMDGKMALSDDDYDDYDEVERVRDVYLDDKFRLLSDGTLFIDGKKVHDGYEYEIKSHTKKSHVNDTDDDIMRIVEDSGYNDIVATIVTMVPSNLGSRATRVEEVLNMATEVIKDFNDAISKFGKIYIVFNIDGSLGVSEKPFTFNDELGEFEPDENARMFSMELNRVKSLSYEDEYIFLEGKIFLFDEDDDYDYKEIDIDDFLDDEYFY